MNVASVIQKVRNLVSCLQFTAVEHWKLIAVSLPTANSVSGFFFGAHIDISFSFSISSGAPHNNSRFLTLAMERISCQRKRKPRTPSKICGIIIHWPLDIGFIWTAFISYLLSAWNSWPLDPLLLCAGQDNRIHSLPTANAFPLSTFSPWELE